MKKSRFTEEQIAFALRQAEAGTKIQEITRKLGISEQTFYRWKRKFAGLGVSELRRLKQLESGEIGSVNAVSRRVVDPTTPIRPRDRPMLAAVRRDPRIRHKPPSRIAAASVMRFGHSSRRWNSTGHVMDTQHHFKSLAFMTSFNAPEDHIKPAGSTKLRRVAIGNTLLGGYLVIRVACRLLSEDALKHLPDLFIRRVVYRVAFGRSIDEFV